MIEIEKKLWQCGNAFDLNPATAKTCTHKPRNTAPIKCTWCTWGREHNLLPGLAETRKLDCALRRYLLLWPLLFDQLSDNSHNVGSMWIIKLISPQQVALSDRSNPSNQLHFAKRIMRHNGPIHILSTLIYLWFINNCQPGTKIFISVALWQIYSEQ